MAGLRSGLGQNRDSPGCKGTAWVWSTPRVERLQCRLWPAEVNALAKDGRAGPRPEPGGTLTSGRLNACPQDAQQAHEM